MKHPNMAGFVGHGGDNVWLEQAQTFADDDPLVLARPDLFVDAEPAKRGPGRPKGSVNKPKPPGAFSDERSPG